MASDRPAARDRSAGYDDHVEAFSAARSTCGCALVRAWAKSLPSGGSIVDVGSGSGEPVTSVLIEEGPAVWAIDASPRMVATLNRRLPSVVAACEPAERSDFFGRRFDAVLMVGLLFLLTEDDQRELLRRVADALEPSGVLLFSAPREACRWTDVLTGHPSRSLGHDAYERLLRASNLALTSTYADEGTNHYYEARRATREREQD